MNSLNLIGNLTADVELKQSANGTSYCQFNIGVQRSFIDKKSGEYKSDFPRCKAFGKTAEIISQHFKKGHKIGITGVVQTDRYEDKDGKTIFSTDVLVDRVTFVERKNKTNEQSSQQPKNDSYTQAYGGQTQGKNTQQQEKQHEPNPFKDEDGPVGIGDDNLPF